MSVDTPAALMALYTSLTFPGGQPPIYKDAAPADKAPPAVPEFVLLSDVQESAAYDFELFALETTRFALTVYAASLVRCVAVAEAIKYGGQNPRLRAGFDFAPRLPDLPAGRRLLHLIRTAKADRQDEKRGATGGVAFRFRMEYQSLVLR